MEDHEYQVYVSLHHMHNVNPDNYDNFEDNMDIMAPVTGRVPQLAPNLDMVRPVIPVPQLKR